MKKVLFILLVLLISCAQPKEETHVHTSAIMKLHAANDSMQLHDFTVSFNRPEIKAGEEATLAFTIMKSDKPLPLEETHGALMHIIIVSRDLEKFYHLHPHESKPGTESIDHVFEEPGGYRVWIEFKSAGLTHVIDYDVSVK